MTPTPSIQEGDLLWQPTTADVDQANLTRYMNWLATERDLHFESYNQLWHWSVTEIEAFWESLWHYFDVVADAPPSQILAERTMPNAHWFEGARLNYAENIFAQASPHRPALLYQSETSPLRALSWDDLTAQVAALQAALVQMGVGAGDRVVAYVPHIPEAVVGLLATAALGAVWSSCSPDFGPRSVLDRFSQIEPKVLLTVDGYHYNGKAYDRREVVAQLQASLPTLQHTIHIPQLADVLPNAVSWHAIQENGAAELQFVPLPFDHPLWVLYSSGTTGLPKPIVQGQGGILLEHLKALHFHNDLKQGERFFWYTSTGWMMWNYLVGTLLVGATPIIYNGSPAYPTLDVLWELAEKSGMNYFGLSPAYVAACMKAGLEPNEAHDFAALRAIGSTGAPLPTAAFTWLHTAVKPHLPIESLSGGTDLCTAFVGGCRLKPLYAGELQGASLGAKVQAFNGAGEAILNEVGELVIVEPMPSMPLYFWNDEGGQRYRASYFEMFPNVWRHGDWIKFNERGGAVIYGRSDSTINRKGVRMGTSEIYQAVESLPEILDSLVVDLEGLGRDSYLPLFVVLRPGVVLDESLRRAIAQTLRQEVSPRHVPDEIFAIEEIPYTLSGKKMEVPVRRVLLGQPLAQAANVGAMRNPTAMEFFVAMAKRLTGD